MFKTHWYFGLFLMSFCLLFSSGVYSADIEAGRIVSTRCAVCHGSNGEGMGAPKSCIACLDASTFKKHIHDFKSGVRKNVMMERFVADLTERDIENVAAYYATK